MRAYSLLSPQFDQIGDSFQCRDDHQYDPYQTAGRRRKGETGGCWGLCGGMWLMCERRFASLLGGTSPTFCILIPLLTACRSLSSSLPSVFLYRSGPLSFRRPPFLVDEEAVLHFVQWSPFGLLRSMLSAVVFLFHVLREVKFPVFYLAPPLACPFHFPHTYTLLARLRTRRQHVLRAANPQTSTSQTTLTTK